MAIQQAAVTITGFVAGDPVLGGTDTFPVLTFRMGSTRSRFNQSTQQWEDFATAWITVKAFRALAKNTKQSVRRGDRIVVVGVLNTDQWTTEQGEARSKTVVEATNIGMISLLAPLLLPRRSAMAPMPMRVLMRHPGKICRIGSPMMLGPGRAPTPMPMQPERSQWNSASPRTIKVINSMQRETKNMPTVKFRRRMPMQVNHNPQARKLSPVVLRMLQRGKRTSSRCGQNDIGLHPYEGLQADIDWWRNYQIRTRASGSSHMASPSVTLNAS